MKIITLANSLNPEMMLVKAGYSEIPNGSYVLNLRSGHYPRFHIYINNRENGELEFNLHLDQTPAVYSGVKAHRGESDSEVVVKEAERLKRWIGYYQNINKA